MEDTRRARDVLPTLIAIAITFLVLDTLFLALRSFSRFFIQKAKLGTDDFLMIPAYFLNIGMCTVAILMAKYEMVGNPLAREVIDDPALLESSIIPGTKCIYALLPCLYFGSMFPKLSLLALYLRIFPHRSVRIWTYILIGLVTAAGLTFTLGGFFACTPARYFWDRTIPGGHCLDLNLFYRANTPINIAIDLAILVVPMPALWSMQAPTSKKVGLTVVFGLGGLGMLACLARFIVLMKYRAEVLIPFNTMTIVGWCIIEPSAYFIAACLPPCSSIMMIVLGNRHVRGVFSRRTKSGTMASPGSRPSRYPRLSSKPLSGFSHLVDSEDSPRGRPRPSFSAPTSPRSPFKDSRHAVDSKASQPDVPLQDISGIGIRTDIYVTESERQSAQDNLSLPDMLGSGSA